LGPLMAPHPARRSLADLMRCHQSPAWQRNGDRERRGIVDQCGRFDARVGLGLLVVLFFLSILVVDVLKALGD
jgi:hypothetical protein